jgi:hypothetical protein
LVETSTTSVDNQSNKKMHVSSWPLPADVNSWCLCKTLYMSTC